MRIVLIGNYLPDGQESMQRFATMLENGFRSAGTESEIWWPNVFFGCIAKDTGSGLGKWLGYLDKWIVFPLLLRFRIFGKNAQLAETYFHICDHSNSPYLNHLPVGRRSITCHDVLAIRGGLGYADAHAPASPLGKILQKWIFNNLSKAEKLAAVSQFTLNQLQDLVENPNPDHKHWKVIHNAFNADFYPMEATQARALLAKAKFDFAKPFLLHVGSGLPRKNRVLLLDMMASVGERWQGNVCFAGEAVDAALLQHANSLGLQERIISMIKPAHDTLVALYSTCTAFIFPSYSEGFGWPIIEAQACGAPVVASCVDPMTEVSGGAALHADPSVPKAFGDALLTLQNPLTRATLVQRGLANSNRFEPAHMIQAYLNLYESTPG